MGKDTGLFIAIKEAIMEYIARTGQTRRDFVCVCHPEAEIMKLTPGRVPTKIVGVDIVTNTTIDAESFVLIPREDLEFVDQLIIQLGFDADPEPEIILCKLCRHPINDLLTEDFETVTCPWCNTENDLDDE